jgi:prolyl-tRNA editing enzyme YbaK/EbsC (Cys-tRNA(Pro) deacylase)
MYSSNLLSSAVCQCLGRRLEECTVLEHALVRTCEDVNRILSVPLERIVKCVVLKAGDGSAVVVAVPATRRVNICAVERVTGQSGLKTAKAREVTGRTGMPVGAVSPLGLPTGVRILIDSALASEDKLYCGTGNSCSSLVIAGRTLVELTGALVAPVGE